MSIGTTNETFDIRITLTTDTRGRKQWFGNLEKRAGGATLDRATFQVGSVPTATVGALVGTALKELLDTSED